MHPQQLKKKASRPFSSRIPDRMSTRSTTYLKTRIRGSRLLNVACLLLLAELTQRLHQAYAQAYDKQAADQLLPQNPGRQIVPLGNLQKGLEGLLKGDCGVFVQKLIDKANQLYGGGRPRATSFWDAFSRIQDAGGYQLSDVSNGGTVGGELFVGELVNPSLPEGSQAGPGTVYITPFGPIGRSARPAEAALAQARYVYKALHETLHLSKRGWYYDGDLALAGHAVDGTTAPEYGKDDTLNWSKEFDNVLQRHC